MSKSPKTIVDRELIHELTKLLDETGLTEIEIEQDGKRVRVARASIAAAPPSAAVRVEVAPQPGAEAAVKTIDPSKHPGVVISPMVGTAYAAAEPGARPDDDGALLLRLKGPVVEEPATPDPLAVLSSGSLPAPQYRARDLVRVMDAAATDGRIKAVVLDLSLDWDGLDDSKKLSAAQREIGEEEYTAVTQRHAVQDDPEIVLPAHLRGMQVENMPIKTTGSAVAGGWNLYANGYVAQNITVTTPGSYLFGVTARGTPLGGVFPHMVLRIDDTFADAVTVGSTGLSGSAVDHPPAYYFAGWLAGRCSGILATGNTSCRLVGFKADVMDFHGDDRDQYRHGHTHSLRAGAL